MKMKLISTFAFIALLALASCSKSDNALVSAAASQVSAGTWHVSLFLDSGGGNETSNFAGYGFSFNSDGTLVAINGSTTKNGSWSVASSSVKFIINLGPKDNTNRPLGELTDDWKIISSSATELQLRDDSNSEKLTFTKN
jgi:hypothetical protein